MTKPNLSLPNIDKIKNRKWLLITLIAVFILIIMVGASALTYELKYHDKIFPGLKISTLNLSGLTQKQAIFLLDQITENISQEGIKVTYKNGEQTYLKITPAINALRDPDLSREIIYFDNQKTAETLYSIGRDQNLVQNTLNRIKLLLTNQSKSAQVEINKIYLKKLLQKQFSEMESPTKNARPKVSWFGHNYQLKILPEEQGLTLNYDQAIERISHNLKNLNNSSVEIEQLKVRPKVNYQEALAHQSLVDEVLATTTPTLKYEKNYWTMEKWRLADMLEFQKKNNQVVLGLDYNKWYNWVEQKIMPTINLKPRDASIELNNGRVTKFVAHRNGREIDIKKTYQLTNQAIGSDNLEVMMAVNVLRPKVTTEEINDMGIKEIIGVGRSNFAGSPWNRRHNISVGAKKLHGVLIKPNEEFSLMDALGDINAEAGYRQELVIKGNETTPEYGGGLCQIGTTTFRAAIYSGLPITERRPHAYNVSYYLMDGKPGMDATIYDPHPDVRFINDTGHYILIQTEIQGDDLIFEFWGTKDGRKIEMGDIKNWDWVKPEPTKYVETLDLPVGKQKCTESSHWGVKASFDYTVIYPDGEKKQKTFYSKYRPWQAVCLIGVEKLSEEIATTTPPI